MEDRAEAKRINQIVEGTCTVKKDSMFMWDAACMETTPPLALFIDLNFGFFPDGVQGLFLTLCSGHSWGSTCSHIQVSSLPYDLSSPTL